VEEVVEVETIKSRSLSQAMRRMKRRVRDRFPA
jgi:hypothetical protein